mmetsp:Transcript_85692/g.247429  ORF Transcript_85692/g.247429 Transcript_85692/m.247429 type:complete len:290 (-) Transcript_85692:489-1358(-)
MPDTRLDCSETCMAAEAVRNVRLVALPAVLEPKGARRPCSGHQAEEQDSSDAHARVTHKRRPRLRTLEVHHDALPQACRQRQVLLVHVQGRYCPMRLHEVLRVTRHILGASHRLGQVRACPSPTPVPIVTAKLDVEDDAHVPEVLRRASARVELEVREGEVPSVRERCNTAAGLQIGRLLTGRPEPSADVPAYRIPLRRISAAAVLVQRCSERTKRPSLGAALLFVLADGVDIADIREGLVRAGLPLPGKVIALHQRLLGARSASVQRCPGVLLHVDALNDVELAPCRP